MKKVIVFLFSERRLLMKDLGPPNLISPLN